jgi:RND family efflux transporter MFP subunit
VQTSRLKTLVMVLLLLGAGSVLVWSVYQQLEGTAEKSARKGDAQPVPVEVAAIERGPLELQRTFTGNLEARAEFLVAPKVSGRIEQLTVDLGDSVTRGQVVAVLDDAEYVQAVARARADLEVARASNAEAHSLLKIAERELKRMDQLRERGVSSESQRDAAMAEQLAKQALVKVTKAQIARAEADLEAARIRLSYTQVTAGWHGGGEQRVVAERYVDEGETVAANAPLLRIVELDPVTAVFFVTERDYAQLQIGQSATLSTDAFPGETFQGHIQRIAPVFRESSRQARVELRVVNPELRLKPGMFARSTVIVDRAEQAVIVPEQALTTRNDREGVFLVSADEASVAWREVQTGIRQGERVQVTGEDLKGRVVVLGQQLLDDGSSIRISVDSVVETP